MSAGEAALLLFGMFAVLIILRVPVAFALGLACVPVFFISDRLTPSLLFDQMFKSYNSFVLLAVPFFLLERTATHMQDPFQGRPTDTPVTSIARTIEINVLQQLGGSGVPEPLAPDGFYL